MLRTLSNLAISASRVSAGQRVRGRQSLLEHVHECIEVAFILIADVARKTGGLLAIEGHQLGQSGGVADGLLVIGNGLLGFGDRRILLPKSVRPKPSVDGLLVRFQDVLAQAKTSMKKRPVVRVRSVEILDQA
jgi:hypothetical protein